MQGENDRLSQREDEILRLASEGFTDKEIATQLGVRLSTVRTYWDRLKNKLGASNRTEAVARSIRQVLHPETEALRTIADLLPHHLVVTDAEGRVEFENARWRSYFGTDGDFEWDQAVHSEDLEVVRELWNRVSTVGGDGSCRVRCRRRDGAFRWHLLAISPFQFREGAIEKWLRIAVDVHDLQLQESACFAKDE